MSLYLEGLVIGRIFASEIGGAYFREGFFLGGGRGAYYRNFTVIWNVLVRYVSFYYTFAPKPVHKFKTEKLSFFINKQPHRKVFFTAAYNWMAILGISSLSLLGRSKRNSSTKLYQSITDHKSDIIN